MMWRRHAIGRAQEFVLKTALETALETALGFMPEFDAMAHGAEGTVVSCG